jgi:periplasmic protein TonB
MAHSGKRAFAFVAIMLALALPTLSQEPDKTASPESQSQPNSAQPQPPPKRVRVSQGVLLGMIVSKVQPGYPRDAKKARINGPVVMQASIGTNGDVIDLRLVSGHPLLAPAAMDAVKQWKYRPYKLNGTPIEVETTITFNFTLSGG